ncbi:MAG: CPBP family intramembrane metalloprotease, partial [Arenimonas sp.]|uniref:CPBP family intramembrane glutamic endopeptidase n=1 Tax=Arenimonas sp. TaxID=1872635 RepID=UPI0025C1CE73
PPPGGAHGTGREVPLRPALPWRGFLIDCLLVVVLLIGLTLLLVVPIVMLHTGSAVGAAARPSPEDAMAAAMPAITAAAIVAMLVTAVLVWWLRGRPLVGSLARMASTPAYGLAITAGLVIQLGAQSWAWLLAQSGAGIQPSNAQPVTALLATAPWMAWLLVVVVGPFAEELLMRHVLLRRFAVAGHGAVGLVLTSLVFALLHEPAPTGAGVTAWLGGLALYAGMGAAFGWVYLRTGRFRATFLAHAACNAAALVVAAYSTS